MTKQTTWRGCYDDGWKGLVVDDAFAHPAKFARGLIERIADYLDLPRGSVVVDPFGGVGLGGIVFASRGVQWYGCELEAKFIELAQRNFEMHSATWLGFGDPMPVIVQGDSRRLRENFWSCLYSGGIEGGADCVVGSPPFLETSSGGDGLAKLARAWNENPENANKPGFRPNLTGEYERPSFTGDYGATPGQLGNMPAGQVDAVVGSPPFQGAHDGTTNATSLRPPNDSTDNVRTGYGDTTPGQLGNMPAGQVDAVVGSPPYAEAIPTRSGPSGMKVTTRADGSPMGYGKAQMQENAEGYGATPGQLGNMPAGSEGEADTFWTAAADIVRECYAILKPGGLAVWVCKDFVRKGQRVPFSDDWERLCISCGFESVERIQASLVKTDRHPSLFGGEEVTTKKTASFFRRLAESKGSPKIDWEDVLVLRKP